MLLALTAILFLLVIFLKPEDGFGISLISYCLFIVPNGRDVSTFFFLFLLFKVLLFRFIVKKEIKFKSDATISILGFLLIYAILSSFFAPGINVSEYIRRHFMSIVILTLFLNIYNTIDKLEIFVKYVFFASAFLLLHIYTQTIVPINPFATPEFTAVEGRLLPHGMADQYVNSNLMGSILVFSFSFVCSYLVFFKKENSRFSFSLQLMLYFLSILPALGLLGSRSGFIILILSFVVIVFRLNFLKTLLVAPLVVLILSFFIGFVSLNFDNRDYQETNSNVFAALVFRFSNTSEDLNNENISRLSLAEAGIKIFLDNILFGVGVGNEASVMKEEKYAGTDKVSHNTFVSLLSEMGLFGLFVIIWIGLLWFNDINNPIFLNILFFLGAYALVHNILLMSYAWLIILSYRVILRNS